ncbi:26071_t:CDS:2, partial [Gigaspora rosea]
MSCDLVFDLVPHRLLDYHRTHDPTFTALYFEPNKSKDGGRSSSSYKDNKDPKQFVGVDTNKSRIVYVASCADQIKNFLYACHYYRICNGAKIMEKSQLKDCKVGKGYVVVSETQAKNE